MNYRTDKYGNQISILGYGCMRFTQTAGRINMEKAEKEIMSAFHQGVNYYDTAYVYPGSEAALGEILERNQIRDQVYIATKLPHYLIQQAASKETPGARRAPGKSSPQESAAMQQAASKETPGARRAPGKSSPQESAASQQAASKETPGARRAPGKSSPQESAATQQAASKETPGARRAPGKSSPQESAASQQAAPMEKFFKEQLRRLRTDYVDYYLMHMLTDVKTWERLKNLGIVEWLEEKKTCGAIRQVGFSYHGNSDMFCQLVDAYDWDFCQIQYNYMDEHSQAGRTGLQYASKKGLPVVIMEPLRGGRLVTRLPEEAKKIFAEYSVKHTPVQWALRWLWNQPEVTCVLSGMNSLEMVEDNCRTASTVEAGEFGAEEEQMLTKVVAAINSRMKVGCTGCRYCMPCPKNVDIPGTFAAYNRCFSEGKFAGLKEYFMCTAMRRDSSAASNCVGCGKCETHCPQHIEIRRELKNARKKLEGPLYKTAAKIVRLLKAY